MVSRLDRRLGRVLPLLTGMWLVYAFVYLVIELQREILDPGDTDFIAFASGAHILRAGSTCLYCSSTQIDVEAQLLNISPAAGFHNPYTNAPLAAWLMQPLAGLQLSTAAAVFAVFSLACLMLGMVLLWRRMPQEWSMSTRAAVTGLGALTIGTASAINQWDYLLLLLALAALLAFDRDQPGVAGLLLGAMLIKPQAVWLVGLALVAGRQWRALGGMAAAGAIWLVTGLLIVGPKQLWQWPQLILSVHVGEASRTAGLPAIVADITGNNAAGFISTGLFVAVALLVAWRARNRLRDPVLAVACGLIGSLLFSPHVYLQDLCLLTIPLLLWTVRSRPAALGAMLIVNLALVAEAHAPLGGVNILPYALLLFCGAGSIALLRRAPPSPA